MTNKFNLNLFGIFWRECYLTAGQAVSNTYSPSNLIVCLKLLIFIILLFFNCYAFAGTDLASGAADDLIATEKGTGLKIAYAVEFIVAVGAAIFKRSIGAFLWIFGIAVFATFVFGHFLT